MRFELTVQASRTSLERSARTSFSVRSRRPRWTSQESSRGPSLFVELQHVSLHLSLLVCSELILAVHPGDVRKAQCVRRPELMHLKNVIVFNVKGKRPLPNMSVDKVVLHVVS